MKGRKPSLDNVVPMKGAAAPAAVPDCPVILRDTAREVWEELAPVIATKGRLALEYRYQFAAYCENVASFLEATTTLALEGTYYETKGRNGLQKKRNPAAVHQKEAMDAMRRDSALFGLSPVDAQRIDTGGQGDLFGDIMKQLRGDAGN
ncbi:P27 family phage terminase small subunit [uncultured Maritimibacter sp.]|jgi:P27 family predicted phage terminase small subunit|uniref:P27 family phage terminase small subunit n=1 Tax=uncultured Maritimibacter sp. TaxID=991866 RepID=UPI00263720CF|nr:P27 family phage terminase small subunit [uncultured Maritimibacter sp.]